LRNVVPIVDYLAAYRLEVLGFLEAGAGAARRLKDDGTTTNVSTLASLEDYKRRYDKDGFTDQGVNGAPYAWGRFFVDSTAVAGAPTGGVGVNPYPEPKQPYVHFKGHYKRLLPEPPVAP
jgi:hypothetical protein